MAHALPAAAASHFAPWLGAVLHGAQPRAHLYGM
jgi:hypothetical protein